MSAKEIEKEKPVGPDEDDDIDLEGDDLDEFEEEEIEAIEESEETEESE